MIPPLHARPPGHRPQGMDAPPHIPLGLIPPLPPHTHTPPRPTFAEILDRLTKLREERMMG